MKTIVPAREGRAVRVAKGQTIRITTPKGAQAADFFAYNADASGEWFSANHTWVTTFNVKPREGDLLLSRFRRPMLKFTRDGANGVHDMMIAACDQFRYEFFGHKGPHASCSENLCVAMRREGQQVDVIPQPLNFFTNTTVEKDGSFKSPPNPVAARRLRGTGSADEPDLRCLLLPLRPACRRLDDQCGTAGPNG
jgi:uncharacterized protein